MPTTMPKTMSKRQARTAAKPAPADVELAALADAAKARRDSLRHASRNPSQTLRHTAEPVRRDKATIFISYARLNLELVADLVAWLRARGADVVWDQGFPGGPEIRTLIEEAISAAACTIVVWTPQSTASRWVKIEAAHALSLGRLLPTHLASFDPKHAPIDFRDLNMIPVDDRTRIAASLAPFGISITA